MLMQPTETHSAFSPLGNKARGASSAFAGLVSGRVGASVAGTAVKIANVGDYGTEGNKTMTDVVQNAETVAETVSPIEATLGKLVASDGKTGTFAFDYMLLASAALITAPKATEEADSLIVAICDKTGARGKPTKDFPKGKANPNAIKGAGFAMSAECARLVRKIGKAIEEGNERVIHVVNGTLGIILNATLLEEAIRTDDRVIKAGDDSAKLERATAKVTADYLASTYGEARCSSFAELRRQLDKATASKAETTSDSANAEGDGEGEGEAGNVTVSQAATVLGADEMAKGLIGRVAELSDETLAELLAAVSADVARRSEADDETRKAA
jgi:hypothetical protein